MLLIPAIDLLRNQCVRLKQGNFYKKTTFSKNPILVVNKWICWKAKRIHLVDLNGAIEGSPRNLFMIKSIIKLVAGKIPIQVGGGIRSIKTIRYYFNIGVSYIVLGTRALTDINFLNYISNEFPNKIILSLDIKNDNVLISGWRKRVNINLCDFLNKIRKFPLESIICTDVNKDGTLTGINLNIMDELSDYTDFPIICSGGLKNIEDLKHIYNLQKKNILGVICGKSIYNGQIFYKNIQSKINFLNNIYIH